MNRLPPELIDNTVSFIALAANPSNVYYDPSQKKRADVKHELATRVKLAPLATISVAGALFHTREHETNDFDRFGATNPTPGHRSQTHFFWVQQLAVHNPFAPSNRGLFFTHLLEFV
jgi:hypothetical protein